MALNQGGVDVDCGSQTPPFYTQHMCDAVAAGAVAQADVDRAVGRYWRAMMRLGMCDTCEPCIRPFDIARCARRSAAPCYLAREVPAL